MRRSARALSGPYTCCVADSDSACQIPLPSNANALHIWSQSVPESEVYHVRLYCQNGYTPLRRSCVSLSML